MGTLELDLEEIRGQFPALRNFVWFQNGVVSLTPRRVADVHALRMLELLENGPMHVVRPKEEYERRHLSKTRIARFIGADQDETALMRGVSEGYLTVLRGIDWKPGDEVVLTEDEEAALLLPTLQLRDLHGVVVRQVPLQADPEAQVKALRVQLTDRCRLVAVSHVTTDLGVRLPIREICEEANKAGALSFVDLAHSAGLVPIDVREIRCDFAGLVSYKWMYAPYAVGLLYVRPDRLANLRLTYAGGRAQKWIDFRANAYELRDGAERLEYGPWSWPLVHAWAEALDFLEEIGLGAIWRRTAELAVRLKTGISKIPGTTLLTPVSPDASGALVSFAIRNWSGKEIRDEVRSRWNVVLKRLLGRTDGVRASIAFFLLEEEIDLLVEATSTLARERHHLHRDVSDET